MTAFGGVNLRTDDIDPFLDACAKAGVYPGTVPVLLTAHDDTETSTNESIQQALDAKLLVVIWRAGVNNSRLLPTRVPATDKYGRPSVLQLWNEADDDSAYPNLPGWVDGIWQWVRQLNRGLLIQYGAPNVNGFLIENRPLEAALDSVGRHVGSTWDVMPSPPPAPDPDPDYGFDRQPFWHLPPPTVEGKPSMVSEIDVDPNRYPITSYDYPWSDPTTMRAAYGEVLGCIKRCLAQNIPALAWGVLPDIPDCAYDPDLLQNIDQLNARWHAENAYNLLTGGSPFVPGKQYVQDDGSSGYRAVVQYQTETEAETAYNQVTDGLPMIQGRRYVQRNADGTYTAVVAFPL